MHTAALRCRIRAMQPEDIRQVLDIERNSFPRMWPQTTYRRELKNAMARYLVAYEPADPDPAVVESPARPASGSGIGGMVRRLFGGLPPPTRDYILGVVGLWCMMGEGHIVTIAVRPEHRRQGIGELLLVTALDAALAAYQDEVTLEFRISNQAARSLYEKYGFTQVGVRARYYSDNQEDAVLMATPPLRSSRFRRLLAQRIADQQRRWGDAYPLAGRVEGLTDSTPSSSS